MPSLRRSRSGAGELGVGMRRPRSRRTWCCRTSLRVGGGQCQAWVELVGVGGQRRVWCVAEVWPSLLCWARQTVAVWGHIGVGRYGGAGAPALEVGRTDLHRRCLGLSTTARLGALSTIQHGGGLRVVAILLGVLIGALGRGTESGGHLLLIGLGRSGGGGRVVVLSGDRRDCIIFNVALGRRSFRLPPSVRLVALVSGGLLVGLVVICPPVLWLGRARNGTRVEGGMAGDAVLAFGGVVRAQGGMGAAW